VAEYEPVTLAAWGDSVGAIRSCPVCSKPKLKTLSQLGLLTLPDTDEERLHDIRIGASGIVLPDEAQLARWFKVPVPPAFIKSKHHAQAGKEGKLHATFTFLSMLSFISVFFTPNLVTISTAALAGLISGFRSWSSVKKLAWEEDKGIALELTVRKQAFRARNAAWEKLYYCSGCGMVHDRQGKRSLPWYSMLQLVHYPEQEFQTIDNPIHVNNVEELPVSDRRSAHAA
jgi:hypothetical protein